LLSLMSLVSAQTYITGNLYAPADTKCEGDVAGVINVLDGGCDGDSRVKATCAASQVTWGVYATSSTCAGTAPAGSTGTVALNACVSITYAEGNVNNMKFTGCGAAVPAAASTTAVGTAIATTWFAATCDGAPSAAAATISTSACTPASGSNKNTYNIDNCADGKVVTYTYSASGCAVGTLVSVGTMNPTCISNINQVFNTSSKYSCSSSAISTSSGQISGAVSSQTFLDKVCTPATLTGVNWGVLGTCVYGSKSTCANGNFTQTDFTDKKTCLTPSNTTTPVTVPAGVCRALPLLGSTISFCSGAIASAATVGITALVALFAVTVSMVNSM